MADYKDYLFSLCLNIVYGIILISIASCILIFEDSQNIQHHTNSQNNQHEENSQNNQYYTGITIVVLFLISELLLFFTDIPSLGILILSLIVVGSFGLMSKLKLKKVPIQYKTDILAQIKKDITKLSRFHLPCFNNSVIGLTLKPMYILKGADF